jgi:hypothetical protein
MGSETLQTVPITQAACEALKVEAERDLENSIGERFRFRGELRAQERFPPALFALGGWGHPRHSWSRGRLCGSADACLSAGTYLLSRISRVYPILISLAKVVKD